MPDDSEIFRQAVDLINGRAYSYALQSLSGVSSTLRNARWYYLSAIANYGMGNDALAMNQIETAVQMESENMVYRTVLQRMQRTSGSYNQNGQEYQRYADGLSKFCWSYLFLQLFCMFCRCY